MILEETKDKQEASRDRQNTPTHVRMLVFAAFTQVYVTFFPRGPLPFLSLFSWRGTLCLKHGWKSDQPGQILFSSAVRKRFERKHFGRERDRGRHGNYNLGSPTTSRFSTPLLLLLLLPASFRTGSPLSFPPLSALQVLGRFKPIRCGEKETLEEGRVLILAR